ncbi:MAG: hypothetical protein LUQ16_00715 [Methanomassiliicoccales archaeon]|nr:hypothetical protein [Methanomassiliicoccales archaeon]MDD1755582.1 hypothetical protein [Methanomassiliicoccales archaeon]
MLMSTLRSAFSFKAWRRWEGDLLIAHRRQCGSPDLPTVSYIFKVWSES